MTADLKQHCNMRLDYDNEITPRGWLTIAFCVVILFGLVLWAAITVILKLWMFLVTL